MKPRSVLLDANVIIESYAIGVWNSLMLSLDIAVPSIITRQEAKYFIVAGKYNPIQLAPLIANNQLRELAADTRELSELINNFGFLFSQSIDAGEHEALALFLAGRCAGHHFCTADAAPIQSLAMLDMSDCGISLEELLQSIGIAKPLDKQFRKSFFEQQIMEGKRRRSEGDGLSLSSRFRR